MAMRKMSGLERVLTALKCKEPDRVPHFERVAKRVIEGILPGASYEDLVEYLDLDGIRFIDRTHSWSYEVVDEARRVKRDQWGGLVRYTTEDNPIPFEPAIRSEKDLDNYVLPDPDEEWRYEYLKQVVKRFKGERAIVVGVTDIFALGRENFLGDVGYFRAMVKNPDLIDRVNELLLSYQLRYIKNCIELGADVLWINGDWAMTEKPMVSRQFAQRFLTPPLQKLVEYAHSWGVPCIKHTDGNIWPIYDLILDTGVDGLHPIDPMAGMDIGEAKAKFGDRVCLCGNVSCAFSLVSGTEEEVRQETKEVIRKAGRGGGLICMSSNSIHSGVKPANYLAMVKAIREFGQYPLALD
jgi:uroporphyrinogen decarboxylase